MASSDPEARAEIQESQGEFISLALRRRLQECFEQANKLINSKKCDRDYANTLYTQCLVNDPGNLTYVQAFLSNLQEKYNNNKKGARIKGFGGRGPFKKAVAQKDWRQILRLGPELLKTNPWDIPTLRSMAEACEALAHNEAELRYLKNALDANPKDADVNRHCGASLARMGQFDQAIACWHRVEELDKKDTEATKMVSLLSEDKQRIASGLPPKFVPQPRGRKASDEPKSEEPQIDLPDDMSVESAATQAEVPSEKRHELEQAIADEPANIDNYLQLAELLRDARQFADAESVLNKALAASGNDLKVRERLEDTQIDRARQQLAIAEKRANAEATDEAKDLAKQLRRDLNRQEIEVIGRRAERYPNDSKLKLDLANCLKRDGNYSEAINYLLKAREDKAWKASATLEMGECLQFQKKFSKALQCYGRAAELAEDDQRCRKLALYRAGVLATGMRELEQATAYLTELVQIDADFKDVKARLDKIERIRNKE